MGKFTLPKLSYFGGLVIENSANQNPKIFNCPACGSNILIKSLGHAITAICNSCSSVIDVKNENYQIIEKANKKIIPTTIEIGARGVLFGVNWEAIGFVRKNDGDAYDWDEYLLYNPYHGFRFLIQSLGHWSFAKVLQRDISGLNKGSNIDFDGENYQPFLTGIAVVEYVKGEFYWRIKKGDSAQVFDYIAPPFMLSCEVLKDEINVSQCQYISAKEVQEAFKLESIPYPISVACNQPSPHEQKFKVSTRVALIAFAFLLLLQILINCSLDNAEVKNIGFYLDPSRIAKNTTIKIADIDLPKDGNVKITSNVSVDNSWVELNFSLVNSQTHETFDVSQAIEYYHGRDSDGDWSEGGRTKSSITNLIPKGKYHLLFDYELGGSRILQLYSTIKRDVPYWGNFWIALVLIFAYPIILFLKTKSFETKRWENSNLVE